MSLNESTPVEDLNEVADSSAMSLSPVISCGAYLMLLLATMPDAMFPPVLKALFVDHYEVGLEAAFWFMTVNMIGVLGVLPLLPWMRRRMSPGILIATAALLNGACYWLMSMPLGLGWTLAVRAFEGAPDMVVLAGILSVVSRSGRVEQRGFRFGLAGTVMMLGLVIGLVSGGLYGETFPSGVFLIGAFECGVLAVVACLLLGKLPPRGAHVDHPDEGRRLRRRYPVWPAMLMSFCDRGLGGALTVAGAIYLTYSLNMSTAMAGLLPSITLLMMAVFNGPVGWIADRVGLLRVRIVAFSLYGLAFLGLSAGEGLGASWLTLMFVIMGLGGAGLIPTTFALGARSGGGATDMGLLQGSGQFGYVSAIVLSGIWVTGFPGGEPQDIPGVVEIQWVSLFVGLSMVYLLLNVLAVLGILIPGWKKVSGRAVTCNAPT
ncbi:MAG: hypothetical protein CMJ36_03525 [Phycisphaerae bacterium]|nr:hypothetical protein [Phycisphaerae bacterium]